jgi:hypothetical protein
MPVVIVVEHDCEGALRVFRNPNTAYQVSSKYSMTLPFIYLLFKVAAQTRGRILGNIVLPRFSLHVWIVCRDRDGEKDSLHGIFLPQASFAARKCAFDVSNGASWTSRAHLVTIE